MNHTYTDMLPDDACSDDDDDDDDDDDNDYPTHKF